MDIKTIPTSELLQDLAESISDLGICSTAHDLGVTHHKDGFSVAERIATNEKIVSVIRAELSRRGVDKKD